MFFNIYNLLRDTCNTQRQKFYKQIEKPVQKLGLANRVNYMVIYYGYT